MSQVQVFIQRGSGGYCFSNKHQPETYDLQSDAKIYGNFSGKESQKYTVKSL